MNIRTRLMAGIGVINILFVLLAVSSVIGIVKILRWERSIYEVHLVSIDKLIEADRDAYQSHLHLVYHLWAASTGEESLKPADVLLSEINGNLDQVKERFEIFRSLTENRMEGNQSVINDFDRNYAALQRATGDLLSLGKDVSTADMRVYDEKFEDLRNGLDVLTGLSLEDAEREYTSSHRAGRAILIFVAVLTTSGLVISLLILYIMVRMTLRPIRMVSERMAELSRGNGDLTQRLPESGNDEITHLARNMNTFLNKTEEILLGLKDSNGQSNRVRDGLVASIEQNSSAATEISANVESISRQIHIQDSNLQMIKSNQDSMNISLEKLNGQVESQSGMVENSTSAITEMIASIKNLAQVAQNRRAATESLRTRVGEGSGNVNESNRAVQAIYADVDNIIGMTKLISGIAARTNLLAMNAAIEAAHAGDSGRGFAVVADEIRKLAETSSQQSKSINTVLAQVIKNIEEASRTSDSTSRIFVELIEEFGTLVDAFNEISQNSLELDAGGRQILEAMTRLTEQSRSVDRETGIIRESNGTISADLEKITNGSLTISQATSEISVGMREVSQSLEEMRSLSVTLAEAMDSAEGQLNLFRLSR